MRTITIVLLGKPVAAGRPRFTRQGGVYTPPKTADERAAMRLKAQEEMANAGYSAPLEGPLRLWYTAERPIPKSFSRKKYNDAINGMILPVTKPDFDNYLKMVDSIKGVVWIDDSQVCWAQFAKIYSQQPKITLTITEITGEGVSTP